MKNYTVIISALAVLMSCNSPKTPDTTSEADADQSYTLTEVWRSDTILRTCESVLYQKNGELLFVACINGSPTEKNGAGYISKLQPDGKVVDLEWITGLNAPKGMGVYEGKLFVTDIDELVIIDMDKAEVAEKIPVEGASFLNDISIDADGTVYFSDSDTGILWKYSNGTLTPWVQEGLERPNGLFVEKERVLLTSSGSQDLKVINKSTGAFETVTTEIGFGDGIEFTGKKGHYIVSSWAGEVFLIFPDFTKVSLLKTSDQEINSADLGFNMEDQVVYVPTFFDNRVVAYKLE
jgi:hypothetical protein